MQRSKKKLRPTVVLVAERTLSADYKVLFEGIFATLQTTRTPSLVMRRLLAPPVKADSLGRAVIAPLGLRRVEAALLKFTDLTADDVVCTTPEAAPALIGPWTKIVAISSSDYLGNGMSNTTTINFTAGRLYTQVWTKKLLGKLLILKEKFNFKVVAGGAGAWQLLVYEDLLAQQCIDVIFQGYFESAGPQLFSDLINGRSVEKVFIETKTCVQNIQPIKSSSVLGSIELSRGCGRGCGFCPMADKKMEHLNAETILADLQTNVKNGITSVVSSSEDFFRYGAAGIKPDFNKLADLLDRMRKIEALSFMQIDHANITSVLQLEDEQLKEIRRLLSWKEKTDYMWVNMGAESANGRLVEQNCPGKISPFDPEDWSDLILAAAAKMTCAGFFSVFSIILGLPGETHHDVQQTLKLIRGLEKHRAVIFPVFFEPLKADEIRDDRRFTIQKMTPEHLDLFRTCYEINFRKIPRLFLDNQRAGGVGCIKRAAMQVLGRMETLLWRRTFDKLHKQISDGTVKETITCRQLRLHRACQ
ncbi:MAG: radical SAM protein [Planctomycetota bacterium]